MLRDSSRGITGKPIKNTMNKNQLKKLAFSLAMARRGRGLESSGRVIRLRQAIRWHIADNLKTGTRGKGNRARKRIAALGILSVADLIA